MTDKERQGGYVDKVRNDTRRYIQDLLNENERLRVLTATLENEKSHALGHLEAQISMLRNELEHHKNEETRLKRHLAESQAETRRFFDQYAEVEQENSNLANLYVASYRLHGTLDRAQVIDTIQEIVINLIGSEELGIFEADRSRGVLELVSHFGIDPDSCKEIGLGTGTIGQSALSGECYIRDIQTDPPDPINLTACIPLKVGGETTGAIAIFGLLPQKPAIQPVDRELFDLLGTHAATALYCTGLRARTRQEVDAMV